jgi:hypothetical protein
MCIYWCNNKRHLKLCLVSSSSPFYESKTETKMGVEHWWSVTDGSKLNHTGGNREGPATGTVYKL